MTKPCCGNCEYWGKYDSKIELNLKNDNKKDDSENCCDAARDIPILISHYVEIYTKKNFYCIHHKFKEKE